MELQSIMILLLLFALSLLLFRITTNILPRKTKKLPPGPIRLPLIGNLHLLGSLPHQSLAKLSKTYGPVMSLKLGEVTSVVISSPEMAKQVLQKQDFAFSSRFVPDAMHAYDHYKYSIPWLPIDSRWRNLRKIMNSHIFAASRVDAYQDLRFNKVKELITFCHTKCDTGEAVDVGQVAFGTMLNLLSTTIFSKDVTRLCSDSTKEFKELVWNIMVEAGTPNLVDYFPVLRKLDPQGIRRHTVDHLSKVLEIFDDMISERLEQRSKGVIHNDVLDVLLNIREGNPLEVDINQIEHILLDLYVAGTDTTSSSVEWAMAELLKNPETMVNAKEELAQVVGKGKPIKEIDIPNLPYLPSIMKETLRMHPPVPFLGPRRVEEDVQLCGYKVPKGSEILVNAWTIGRDSSVWDDPLEFTPERFMGSEVDVRGHDLELIPFGAGRRICPGIPLVTRMLPLMLGSLINSFDWKLEDDVINVEEKFGVTLQKAHPLRAIPISSL